VVKTAEERAAGALARFERRRPDAIRLATLASLAVRVDANLLRRLRTTLLADADVGVEADLWFSPLVESRGAHGFVFDAASTALLRARLADDAALLARAIAVTTEAHRDAPSTIRLEEEVNGIALAGGDDAARRIDAALRPAVVTMIRDDEQGLDVARWALRALPRFHPLVRTTECGVLLAVGAAARLDRNPLVDRIEAEAVAAEDHRWVLPAGALSKRTTLHVELLDDGLRFHERSEGWNWIELPTTDPLLIHLFWDDAGAERRRTVDVAPGRVIRLGRAVDAVRIRTFAGDQYLLEAVAPEPQPSVPVLEVWPVGVGGEASTGFIVAPNRIVSSGTRLRGLAEVTVRQERRLFRARRLLPPGEALPTAEPPEESNPLASRGAPPPAAGDVLVFEPADEQPLTPALPLQMWLSKKGGPNELIVPSSAEIESVEGGQVVRATALLPVMHDGPPHIDLTIELEGSEAPPVTKPGAPVLVDGEAIGMVVRASTIFGQHRIDAVGAATILDVLKQAESWRPLGAVEDDRSNVLPDPGAAKTAASLGHRLALVPVFGAVGAGKSEVIQRLPEDDERDRPGNGVRHTIRLHTRSPPRLDADIFAVESTQMHPVVLALSLEHAAAAMVVAEANDEVRPELQRWIEAVRAVAPTMPLLLVATRCDVHRHRESQTYAELEALVRQHGRAHAVMFETSGDRGTGDLLHRLVEVIDWKAQPGGGAGLGWSDDVLHVPAISDAPPVVPLDALLRALSDDKDVRRIMAGGSGGDPDRGREFLRVAGIRYSDAANVAIVDPETFERLAVTFLDEGARRGDMVIPWARRDETSGRELDRIMDEHSVDHDLRDATRQALLEQLAHIGAIARVEIPRAEVVIFLSLFYPRAEIRPEVRRPVPLLVARAPSGLWPAALTAAARLEAMGIGRVRDAVVDPKSGAQSVSIAGPERTTRFWLRNDAASDIDAVALTGSEEAGDERARTAFAAAFEESLRVVAPPGLVIERPGAGDDGGPPSVA
jgi:hypothetical protein